MSSLEPFSNSLQDLQEVLRRGGDIRHVKAQAEVGTMTNARVPIDVGKNLQGRGGLVTMIHSRNNGAMSGFLLLLPQYCQNTKSMYRLVQEAISTWSYGRRRQRVRSEAKSQSPVLQLGVSRGTCRTFVRMQNARRKFSAGCHCLLRF